MTYQPPQQPPVVDGYPTQSPSGDWPPPARKRGLLLWLIGSTTVAFLAVGALVFTRLPGNKPSSAAATSATASFDQIKTDCGVVAGYRVEDAGQTLVITVGGAYMNTETASCVFDKLGVPDAVRQHVSMTRALDGQQTDTWTGYSARWTYHPDDGLLMTIRVT